MPLENIFFEDITQQGRAASCANLMFHFCSFTNTNLLPMCIFILLAVGILLVLVPLKSTQRPSSSFLEPHQKCAFNLIDYSISSPPSRYQDAGKIHGQCFVSVFQKDMFANNWNDAFEVQKFNRFPTSKCQSIHPLGCAIVIINLNP